MNSSSTVRMLIIGIVILALISASAMAISKSDLISSYKSQSGSSLSKPMISPTPTDPIPSTPSEVSPFPSWAIPTPIPSSGKSYFPSWFSPSSGKPSISPSSISSTSYEDTGGYIPCPPGVPVGELHQSFGICVSYVTGAGDIIHGDCINPETGFSYPIGIDALGNSYLVKPGCQCTWAE